MGKRKSDKLEEMYQEFDSKFKNASEEEIMVEMAKSDKEVEKTNTEIETIKETIATKKQLIEALQGKDEEASSPRIQKAIEDAKTELKEAQDKLKEQETKASRTEKSKVNLEAYSKNKEQISKIRAFKESMAKKIPTETAKRDEAKSKMEAAEKSLAEANKKLADEKLTMEMDQYEYNTLLEQKAQAEKEVKEQTELYKKAKEKIIELQTKMGKCDLAWRTLFAGKTWDDIQRRALDPNTRFVRQVDENTRLKPRDSKAISPDEQLKEEIAKTVDAVKLEQGERETGENSDLPVPAPKHPRWEKFKNFFKKAGNKLKEIFVGEEPEQENNSNGKATDYSNIPSEKRDQFLEELRKHVDKEYGDQVRAEKEAQYIEQHKAKPKTTEPQEKEDDEVR